MILYKQKPKKMLIGGLVSLASTVSDWISGYDETDPLAQTGATVIDPAGTAIDVLSDENASTEDKWQAGINALAPGLMSFEVGQDTADRNQEGIDQAEAEKRKKEQDKMAKKSQESYAMQYEGMTNPETITTTPTTTTKPTVSTWYNQQR